MSAASSSSPSVRPASGEHAAVACRLARSPAELDRHFAVRRAVFVAEQGLFVADDRDEYDDDPATLHAIGAIGEVTGGAVRLYRLDRRGLWKGDRLAVLPRLRHGLLGAALVRFAVATAGERGGDRMVAMIQLPNVCLFEALGWSARGAIERYHGAEHQPMEIPLTESGRVSGAAR